MKPEVVYTKAAPKTGFSEGMESPIAQGVKCGQFLFVSGQGPLDPATKEVVSPDLAEQTRVTRLSCEGRGISVEPFCFPVIASSLRYGTETVQRMGLCALGSDESRFL